MHDVHDAELVGLQGTRYRETARGELTLDDQAESIHVVDAIDRVYVDAPHRLELREPERQLAIETTGFPDVVVWNPGANGAADMNDMEPEGDRRMLCVEAGVVQNAGQARCRESMVGSAVTDRGAARGINLSSEGK